MRRHKDLGVEPTTSWRMFTTYKISLFIFYVGKFFMSHGSPSEEIKNKKIC